MNCQASFVEGTPGKHMNCFMMHLVIDQARMPKTAGELHACAQLPLAMALNELAMALNEAWTDQMHLDGILSRDDRHVCGLRSC